MLVRGGWLKRVVVAVVAAAAVALAVVSLLGLGRDPRAERRRAQQALLAPYLQPRCGQIPRHLHFIHNLWDDRALNEKESDALQSWLRINKGWDVHIWDREKLDVLFKALGGTPYSVWRTINNIPNHGQRADLTRYLLLSQLGGVYADIDVYAKERTMDELLQCPTDDFEAGNTLGVAHRIPEFLAVTETVLSNEELGYLAQVFDGSNPVARRIGNYFFASEPGGDVISTILHRALSRAKRVGTAEELTQNMVLYTTGPDVTSQVVAETAGRPGLKVLSKEDADLYISHHARGTWRNQFESFRDFGSFT